MKRLKVLSIMFLVTLSCTFSTTIASASVITGNNIDFQRILVKENENSIYATDKIEYVYMVIDGIPHYRRWNATRNYWVDDEWIPC